FSRAALEETSGQAGASRVSTWEAIRQRAAQVGIAASLVYDGQGVVNASGGQRTGSVYLGNFHMMLTLDGDRLLGWPGATLFLNGLVNHRGHPSDLVGDAQGVRKLGAPPGAQLSQRWVSQ